VIWWLGQRTPTVGPPAVTASGTLGDFGRTIVSGPGQNARASSEASAVQKETTDPAIASPLTWTMSGLVAGGPLGSNTLRTAAGFRASAPSPYTVSVGNATKPPARRRASAAESSSGPDDMQQA